MNQHASGLFNRLIGNLLWAIGGTTGSHRCLRAGRALRHIGSAQLTIAHARAEIRRSVRRGEVLAAARRQGGMG